MKLTKLFAISLFTALSAAAPLSLGQTTATTDPVGFITLTVKGTGGTQPNAITFLGLGMTRAVEYQGVADTVSGSTITSNNASWTDNQFASTPKPGYFLEIVSGTKAGLISRVLSCNDAANTLTVEDNLTTLGVTNGVSFKLRPNWSLASIFGPTNQAGLGGGTSTTADLLLLWNPALAGGAGGYDQYFYSTSGLAGTGWRKVGGGSADQKDEPISLDEGLVAKRLQSADVAVVLTGAVKLGQTNSPIFLGPNFIGNVYPSGLLTLGNSNLWTGNSSTGVTGGTSTTADLVLIWDPTLAGGAGGYVQYFYSTSGLAGVGWRKVGGGNADQQNTELGVGKSAIVKRNSGGPFSWVILQPFPNP